MTQSIYRLGIGIVVCAMSGVAFEAAPVQAAAFSFSGSRLGLENVSLLPQAKSSTLVTDAIAQTQSGTADNFFDGTLNFVADEETRLDGAFEARSQGQGRGYFGRSQVRSDAFAEFLVTPQQPLSLDFQIATLLRNTAETPSERATAQSTLSLSLLDPEQTVLKFFTLEANVNTSPVDRDSNEALFVDTNGQILGSNSQLLPGATEEIGTFSFLGRFSHTVSQPTLLTLQIDSLNQSCVQAPDASDACVKVPDQSGFWAFGLVSALGLLLLPRRRVAAVISLR